MALGFRVQGLGVRGLLGFLGSDIVVWDLGSRVYVFPVPSMEI